MVDANEAGESWVKSSLSTSGGCLEVRRRSTEVLVRDSKDPDGVVLSFEPAAFAQFLQAVKSGEFDRPSGG
jgi:Domain of unknown function (DUF397)